MNQRDASHSVEYRRVKYSLSSTIQSALAEQLPPAEGVSPRTLIEPSLEVWSDVLCADGASELASRIDQLAAACSGASLWCPAEGSLAWTGFFSVFASLANAPASAGVEWWVRRRDPARTMDFHIDKDEQLMRREKRLVTPSRSTVYYVDSVGGPTLVAAQIATPGGELIPAVPTELAAVECRANQLLAFPGELSHGVLGRAVPGLRTTLLMNWWDERPTGVGDTPGNVPLPQVRLGTPARVKPRIFLGHLFTPSPTPGDQS
jgi:hypothetical protein